MYVKLKREGIIIDKINIKIKKAIVYQVHLGGNECNDYPTKRFQQSDLMDQTGYKKLK